MTVIIRSSPSGQPIEVLTPGDIPSGAGERFYWSGDGLGPDAASSELLICEPTRYMDNGPVATGFDGQRSRAYRVENITLQAQDLRVVNNNPNDTATIIGALTIKMRLAPSQVSLAGDVGVFAPEVARLVIPAASPFLLPKQAVRRTNWTEPNGVTPLSQIAIGPGDDQWLIATLDKGTSTNLDDVGGGGGCAFYIEWG